MHRPFSLVRRTGLIVVTLGALAAGMTSPMAGQSAAPSSPTASGVSSAAGTVPDGTFVGDVNQGDGAAYMTTLVATGCEVGVVCGSTEYPTVGCGGTLTYNGPEEGFFDFTENITHGSRCEPVAELRVTPMGPDTVDVRYLSSGTELASATLHRQVPSVSPAAQGSLMPSDSGY